MNEVGKIFIVEVFMEEYITSNFCPMYQVTITKAGKWLTLKDDKIDTHRFRLY